MNLLLSVTAWIALALPPACAYLVISHAREAAAPKGRRRVWLWLCVTVLTLSALVIGIDITSRAFAATDCIVGAVFLGCTLTDPAWGETLFTVFWRLSQFFPLILILTVVLLVIGVIRALRQRG